MHLDTVLLPAKHPSDYAANGNRDGQNQTPAPNNDFQMRLQNNPLNNSAPAQLYDRSVALNGLEHNGENWLSFKGMQGVPGAEVPVNLSPMTAAMDADRRTGASGCCWCAWSASRRRKSARGSCSTTRRCADCWRTRSPTCSRTPACCRFTSRTRMQPDRTMTALPLLLDPGPAPPPPNPGWTPLRVGLALAWTAALVALLAVGLGGWSLIDLSQRRIRFVSAVTHELRTPLTTLRLYLDMLMNGLVRDEKQREEYIHTLNAEAERSEPAGGQRARLLAVGEPASAPQPGARIAGRLARPDGRRVAESVPKRRQGTGDRATAAATPALCTDGELVQQVLGNPARQRLQVQPGAADRRVWLRVRSAGRRMVFEVEDRGPGVPNRERRSIFRAFRRGRTADATGGGVGLGLALARRWARLLGGELSLRSTAGGACFLLHLPLERADRTTRSL